MGFGFGARQAGKIQGLGSSSFSSMWVDSVGRPPNFWVLARTRVSESEGAVVRDLPFRVLSLSFFSYFWGGWWWVGLRISGLELCGESVPRGVSGVGSRVFCKLGGKYLAFPVLPLVVQGLEREAIGPSCMVHFIKKLGSIVHTKIPAWP